MVTNREMDKMVGSVIKGKRKKCGITQEKLAELVGICTVYWRDIECGNFRPNWVIMSKICAVLDIDIQQIIDVYVKPELNETGKYMGLKF